MFAGSPAADALSAEALALGQDLAVDDATLAGLFTTRGICHGFAGRRPQAAAYLREAARLAGQAGDTVQLGRALLNLSDAVTGTDPAAGAEAARAAAAQLRRAGARDLLAIAVVNLAQALLMTGDWDAAEAELAQAADADGLADIEFLACYRAWVAALRGDAPAAQAALAGLGDLRASEDPQDQALIAVAEAFTAAALGQPAAALRHARAVLDHAAALGISHEYLRWAWPLAARAAHDLADTATTGELLALLDGYRPGQLAPMQRAERDLARARLAAAGGDPDAGAAFAAAIAGLRQHSTPYHLAHGLLDHAAHLGRLRRDRGRRGRDRRSRRHRPAAGLPAAAGPRGNHPAGQAPHRGLVTTAPASPRNRPVHGTGQSTAPASRAHLHRPQARPGVQGHRLSIGNLLPACRCLRPCRSSGSGALPRHKSLSAKPRISAVSALSRLEAWPRSVTDLGTPHGERRTVGSWMSSRRGAFPPVDGFRVGGHAVEEAGDELDVSAAASGEAELPQFRGGTVVVVDCLIRGIGVDLAGPVAVDLRPDVAEKPGQLRFVVGAHAFARGAPLGFGGHDPDGTVFQPADPSARLIRRYRAIAVISNRHAARLLFRRLGNRAPIIYCPRNGSWFALGQAVFPVLARSVQARHYGFHRCSMVDPRRAEFAEP